MVQIDAAGAVVDNMWLWRADHEAAVFDTQPDTIDSLPAFEIYLRREGETTDAASPGNAGAEVWEAVRRRGEGTNGAAEAEVQRWRRHAWTPRKRVPRKAMTQSMQSVFLTFQRCNASL